MDVYIEGKITKDGDADVPLSSAAILFLLRYCGAQGSSNVTFVEDESSQKTSVAFPKDCLRDLNHSAVKAVDVLETVRNCTLPVVQVSMAALYQFWNLLED